MLYRIINSEMNRRNLERERGRERGGESSFGYLRGGRGGLYVLEVKILFPKHFSRFLVKREILVEAEALFSFIFLIVPDC